MIKKKITLFTSILSISLSLLGIKPVNGLTDDSYSAQNLNLIVLIDRSSDYTSDDEVLGEDFSDTRMYKIEHKKAIRISGNSEFPEITTNSNYEANMGDKESSFKGFTNRNEALFNSLAHDAETHLNGEITRSISINSIA